MRWFTRLAEIVEDWTYLIRRDGWLRALPAIGREIGHLPCRRLRFLVLARSLLGPLPELQPKIALEIREIEACDLVVMRQLRRPSDARDDARRLAQGYSGFLALHNGQLAGYAWNTDQVDQEPQPIHVGLQPGDMLFLGVYTVPSCRGRGVQTALALARIQWFLGLGYHRAIVCIERDNHPSLAVWRRKLGAQVIGELYSLRIGPWRRAWYENRQRAQTRIGKEYP